MMQAVADALVAAGAVAFAEKYNEDQERAANGEFGSGGAVADKDVPSRAATSSYSLHGSVGMGTQTSDVSGRLFSSENVINGVSGFTGEAVLKDKVTSDLAERSGLSYQRCNELTSAWAISSSDTNMDSVALQAAVQDKFGTPPSDYMTASIASFADEADKAYADAKADADVYVAAMYTATQEDLQERGIKEMTVSRGIIMMDAQPTGEQEVQLNPASSFSTDTRIASNFAAGAGDDVRGSFSYVMETTVPAERILSTPLTGIGCANENEVVVVGGDTRANVTAVSHDALGAEALAKDPSAIYDSTGERITAAQNAAVDEVPSTIPAEAYSGSGGPLFQSSMNMADYDYGNGPGKGKVAR